MVQLRPILYHYLRVSTILFRLYPFIHLLLTRFYCTLIYWTYFSYTFDITVNLFLRRTYFLYTSSRLCPRTIQMSSLSFVRSQQSRFTRSRVDSSLVGPETCKVFLSNRHYILFLYFHRNPFILSRLTTTYRILDSYLTFKYLLTFFSIKYYTFNIF